jgi:N-acetylneuraminic acid mutarotase
MRQIIYLLFLFCSFSIFAQDSWVQVDSMNGPGKSVTTSFVVADTAYVVGGTTEIEFTRKMYSFNYSQNDWDDELSWGGETGGGQNRGNAISFVIENIAYVGLGQGNTVDFYNDMWKYDPATATWTQMADFAGEARRAASAFSLDGFGYIGLGQSITGLKNDFWKLNTTTNTWVQIGDFDGQARKNAACIQMGSQIFVGTGEGSVDLADFWEYQPWSDSWIARPNLPGLGRSGAVGWGIYPQVFIALGEDAAGTLKKDVWEYNVFTNAWTQRADFPGTPRKLATAFVVQNKAYVGTGYSLDGFKDDFYSYSKVAELNESLQIECTIYPNPSADFLHIESEAPIEFISIYQLNGKLVEQVPFSKSVSIQHLPNGNYFVEMTTINGQRVMNQFSKI